jgi:hypothetical protein
MTTGVSAGRESSARAADGAVEVVGVVVCTAAAVADGSGANNFVAGVEGAGVWLWIVGLRLLLLGVAAGGAATLVTSTAAASSSATSEPSIVVALTVVGGEAVPPRTVVFCVVVPAVLSGPDEAPASVEAAVLAVLSLEFSVAPVEAEWAASLFEEFESLLPASSAHAGAGLVATANPIPKAMASAPTLPTWRLGPSDANASRGATHTRGA